MASKVADGARVIITNRRPWHFNFLILLCHDMMGLILETFFCMLFLVLLKWQLWKEISTTLVAMTNENCYWSYLLWVILHLWLKVNWLVLLVVVVVFVVLVSKNNNNNDKKLHHTSLGHLELPSLLVARHQHHQHHHYYLNISSDLPEKCRCLSQLL